MTSNEGKFAQNRATCSRKEVMQMGLGDNC